MLSEEAARRPRPDVATLRAGLLPLVEPSECGAPPTLDREPNAYASHYASEIATFTWPNGRTLRLLLKYDDGDGLMAGGLLTVGPAYEAVVYQQVLSGFDVTRPRCFGTWRDPGSGATILVIEYLEGRHVHRTGDLVPAFSAASRWIGRLHALAEPVVAERTLPPLNVYDARLYRYWATRAREFERRTRAGRTWLPAVVDRIDTLISMLHDAPQTVIHGDYYPDNMVYLDGVVSPFDWEQTAIAPGEIDLASLTQGWHPEVLQASEEAYCLARWPGGPPATFSTTLAAARVFVLLRLLGEAPGWPTRRERNARVERLRPLAERLGLI